MNMSSELILTLPIAAAERVAYRISSGLIDSFTEWWQMPALVLGVGLVLTFVLWAYHHDAAGLRRWQGVPLAVLRVSAWSILLLALLDLRRTAEHEISFPSRVAVLVDSSASMTLSATADSQTDPDAPDSRAEAAATVLTTDGLLKTLRQRHEVAVWRFADRAESLVVLPTTAAEADTASVAPAADNSAGQPAGQDWQAGLTAQGSETRLGDALLETLRGEPAESLAGVILLSDGGSNAGSEPLRAAARLAEAAVAVHSIGLGSDQLPANVRVADLLAPARVFPGDRFSITGYLQAQGLEGRTARVELLETDAGAATEADGPTGRVIDTTEVRLAADGELLAVRFDLDGLDESGSRVLAIRVVPPADDSRAGDNLEATDIEVVETATQVLLLAGGPGREYQFLRNVLKRDPSIAVDVLLGSARPGLSQDARSILESFPESADALDAYDVVVAIDYDWRQLEPAAVARLERWISRDSGGLLLLAGGVFMESWLADPQFDAIRTLHPVELRRGERLLLTPRAAAEAARPLWFSPDGEDAEFLWLAANRIASQTVWGEFPGVYSCFDTATAKPGATVYARLASPDGIGRNSDGPIYLAGQLYGSGTIFYCGSSELWRLRGVEPAAHERLATQLVRHVAQGRLLRGSSRGRLLLERDRYPVGETVVVRVLPGSADRRTDLEVIGPEGQRLRVPLENDPVRPDDRRGSFVLSSEGSWRLVLTIDGNEDDRSVRRIQATLPDRELARPQLQRAVLEQLATATGGSTRFLTDATWTGGDPARLAELLPDRSRKEYERGAGDTGFKRSLNTILLATGIGLLCLEWVLRRLAKLA